MAEAKKYYWLKLKRDFFKRHDIRIIEEMPNGKDYILFYLKLLLESIDHEGSLRFSDTIPYNEQMLAVITNTNVDIVKSAMKMFIELHMIDVLDDQTIFMNEVDKYIGSESSSAERVRKHRERKMLQCNTDETNCNIEIEKEKETEEEEENRERIHSFTLSNEGREEEMSRRRKVLGGTLGRGVVMLSDEQMEDLLDKLSIDEFDKYVAIVAECERNGKSFKKKTHYQAILEMAMHDRKVRS